MGAWLHEVYTNDYIYLPSCVSPVVIAMSVLQLAFLVYFWQLEEHQFLLQPVNKNRKYKKSLIIHEVTNNKIRISTYSFRQYMQVRYVKNKIKSKTKA